MEDIKEEREREWARRQILGRMIVSAVHDPKTLHEMLSKDTNPSTDEDDDGPSDDNTLAFHLISRDPLFMPELPDFVM